MVMNKQKVLLIGHISELKSNISERDKELSELKLRKHECEEHDSVATDKCTRLEETEVSINLLSVLLNTLTE
jgi:hypothetical protein